MNRTLKYLSLVLAILFVIAGSTIIVFAHESDIAPVADEEVPAEQPANPPAEQPADTPVEQPADTPVEQPDNGDQGAGGDQGGYSDPNTGVDPGTGTDTDQGSGEGEYYYNNDQYQDDAAGYNNNINNNNNNNEYYGYDEYGDGTGNEEAAGSVTSNTTLYQSSGLTDKEAAPNKWSEITLDEKTVTSGVSSFKSIKTNSNEKTGEWIVYLGYLLIGLAVLGILYFIIATISQRRYDRAMEQREIRRTSAPPRSQAGRMEEQERRQAQAQARAAAPRSSRYADEPYRSRRVSSRADTGEVYVPRRTKAK